MSSWSIFRRIRVGIFVLITLLSLVLTVLYSVFLSKDFHRYNGGQRAIIAASVGVNGITAILMYLMLAVRYSSTWDAVRVIILLGGHASCATLFTVHGANLPCDAFGGGAICKKALFSTAIVSWVLCGLLVAYAACLCIMSCVPRPPPIENLDPELDAEMPVNTQARRVAHLSINPHVRPASFDAGKQRYTAWSLAETRNPEGFVDGAHIRQQVRQVHGGHDASLHRPLSLLPGGGRSPTVMSPSIAQFDWAPPFSERMRKSSLSSSVYSAPIGESMELPASLVPSIGVHRLSSQEHLRLVQSRNRDN